MSYMSLGAEVIGEVYGGLRSAGSQSGVWVDGKGVLSEPVLVSWHGLRNPEVYDQRGEAACHWCAAPGGRLVAVHNDTLP
jgi:hypothetical protein